MSLFQPTQLFKFLESIGHKPSKHLSQNFLIDGNILRKIITVSSLKDGDLVIEIGPGPGVLTEALLNEKAHVVAIEKDPIFAKALARLKTPENTLTVFEDDILEFPLEKFLKKELKQGQKAKIISNLPYHLTSPIFGKILPLYDLIDLMIVMVQKEVADRVVSKKGSKNYSSFSVFTQFYSNPTLLFQVSPQCFYPKPKVTSAVVECKLKKICTDIDSNLFFAFIKKSFSTRRKMLTTSLKESFNQDILLCALKTLNIDEKARPEQLSVEEFLLLFKLLHSNAL